MRGKSRDIYISIYSFQFSKFKYFSIYIIYGIFSGRISRSHVWIWSCVHIKNERKTRQFLLMVGSRNFHHLISWPHILYIKWKLTKISFKNRLTKYIILILRQLRHWNFEASFCLVAIQNQTGLVILGSRGMGSFRFKRFYIYTRFPRYMYRLHLIVCDMTPIYTVPKRVKMICCLPNAKNVNPVREHFLTRQRTELQELYDCLIMLVKAILQDRKRELH